MKLKTTKSGIGLIFTVLSVIAGCSGKTENQQTTNDTPARVPTKNIIFFGNSLTAGYGLADPSEAFPAIIQGKIDSMNLPFNVVNAGVSGETSAGGLGRIDWVLKQPLDVFVLELGANDGLRGLPVNETSKNLQNILTRVKEKYPNAALVLAGMQMPPNMGKSYADRFRQIFPKLAKENNMALVTFLLEGVGGVSELNQADGIHPTAEGAQIVAENVWQVLKPVLISRTTASEK